MPNESNLSSLGWSSMTMVHMARPMIMCNKDVWWIRSVSWLFYICHLKNMNMDMDDDGRASCIMDTHEKITKIYSTGTSGWSPTLVLTQLDPA